MLADVLADPVNAALMRGLPGLGLPQCHLVAGCVFQAVWNRVGGRPPGWGVRDYDVFYFDEDVSWEAEDAVIRRVGAAFAGLGAVVEVRNQARVHLWYEGRFGAPYPRLGSAREGIDRFLIACTCVGVEVGTGALHAPYGLAELEDGVLRPNPRNHLADRFREKAAGYRARWPWLRVEEGGGDA